MQEVVRRFEVARLNLFGQVGQDAQGRARVELRGVGREHHTDALVRHR